MRAGRLLRIALTAGLPASDWFIASIDRHHVRLVALANAAVLQTTRSTFDAAEKVVLPVRERGGRAELARRLRHTFNDRKRLGQPTRPATVNRVISLLEA